MRADVCGCVRMCADARGCVRMCGCARMRADAGLLKEKYTLGFPPIPGILPGTLNNLKTTNVVM